MSKNGMARSVALVSILVGSCSPLWAQAGGDDAYRFAPGAGEERALTLTAVDEGVRWSWSRPAAEWDSALVGVRVAAGEDEAPWVEMSAGSARAELYLDPKARGLRWLNLTRLKGQLSDGTAVEIRGHGVSLQPGAATLRLFSNRLPLASPILIVAPHPDDAEIAAFGFYAGRNATIVTVTSGNAGDANYAAQFPDPAEQYRFKGFLRALDSVTVPWQGGIPPERCYNLGYFDARLATMHAKPKEVVPEMYGPNTDISVYRRANVSRLLPNGPRPSTWANLVEDLATVLAKVKPAIVVMPYPQLDTHADHEFAAVAAVEALERWKGTPRFLLYTNHAFQNLYPFGPAGTGMSLPPWSGPELPVEGFYSHTVSPDLQRRKLFALETMHDLRLSPAEQAACATPGAVRQRDDYPRVPAVDYFRRGPRAEETFFVFGRDGVRDLIRSFLAKGSAQ
jgi:LmbE family N-acetylglucosaminyl deacetylase